MTSEELSMARRGCSREEIRRANDETSMEVIVNRYRDPNFFPSEARRRTDYRDFAIVAGRHGKKFTWLMRLDKTLAARFSPLIGQTLHLLEPLIGPYTFKGVDSLPFYSEPDDVGLHATIYPEFARGR